MSRNNATLQRQQNYIVPFIIMVILMALVGLITNINQQFQAPMKAAYLLMGGKWANTLATLLNFAFFTAYLVMGPISAKRIAKRGYKHTLIFGLVALCIALGIYIASAWVFESFDANTFAPIIAEAKQIEALATAGGVSAMQEMAGLTGHFQIETLEATGEFNKLFWLGEVTVPVAYYIFLIAAFIAGTSMTYLQAVINPYVVASDVPGTTGVQRQNIAGTGNSLMTTIGPLFVAYLIFQQKGGLEVDITSLYLPFAVLVVLVALLAIAIRFIELPDVAGGSSSQSEELTESVWSFRHVKLGVIALFAYVGVEVCVGTNVVMYALDDLGFTIKTAAQIASLYWGGLLVGRFLSSFMSKVSAQLQLLVASIGAILFILLSFFTHNPWLLAVVGLFHSVMWPSVFALALEGLGRYTSKASGVLIMGCFGGALLPVVQGLLADLLGGWHITWVFVVLGELVLLYYAVAGHRVLKRDTALDA